MMKSTFRALAASLYAGSAKLEEISFDIRPGQLPEMDYHLFRVRNAAVGTGEQAPWHYIWLELKERFERAYVPEVAEWLP